MGQLVPDAPEELCEALDAIFRALDRVPPFWAEYADEHARWETYREAVAAFETGRLALESITDCLRIDPDRQMASSATGLLLVPERPRGERELVLASMSDWKWVRERFNELAIFDRLVRSDADDLSDLRDASSWLEEELARCSESAEVLNYLSTSSVRRRARHEARERLRQLTG
jgi:hypothetical protein